MFDFMHEQVSMSKIRQRLSSKHQEIAERLTLMLTKSVKDQAQVNAALKLKCCRWRFRAYTPLPGVGRFSSVSWCFWCSLRLACWLIVPGDMGSIKQDVFLGPLS